ncbi:MAG: hypothetical protein IPK04_05060 [Bdellovibrionales bacterium]|nr:hypothetical protein [Bdellovibrionales bacterium]MBL7671432.1 hypothetical protein [Pseudobdellovibrionaceae bacterium]
MTNRSFKSFYRNLPYFRLGLFTAGFIGGLLIGLGPESPFQSRRPAAIRPYYDFTNLRGSALEVALKERVVSNLEIVHKDKDVGLAFGHFAFTNSASEKTFGCNEYKNVTLKFESADMAISGEKSRMEVQSDCVASADITMIEPIWLPLSKIYIDKPTDGDFQFMEGQKTAVHFSNISDEWPKKWHLIGVKLSNPTHELSVDRNEMLKIIGKPIVLSVPKSSD